MLYVLRSIIIFRIVSGYQWVLFCLRVCIEFDYYIPTSYILCLCLAVGFLLCLSLPVSYFVSLPLTSLSLSLSLSLFLYFFSLSSKQTNKHTSTPIRPTTRKNKCKTHKPNTRDWKYILPESLPAIRHTKEKEFKLTSSVL